jgi:hypothetical protein
MSTTQTRQTSAWDDRDLMTRALRDSHALKSPAELVETIDLPLDLGVALMTGRSELLKLAVPRDMTDEVARLYNVIAVLIDTNIALRAHAQETAQCAQTVAQQIKGVQRYALRLEQFANFAPSDDGGEEG